MPANNILSHFPKGLTPRTVQAQTLKEVERLWGKYDVFVVNLPVASGKSYIAKTIASWAHKVHSRQSCIITPTKLLVDQYIEDFPRLPVLKSRMDYTCHTHEDGQGDEMSCGAVKDRLLGNYCRKCCYTQAIRRAKAVPYVLANNYTYMAHKLWRSCLIADEAHNLINMIRDLQSFKMWWHDWNFPVELQNYKQLYTWLERHPLRDEPGNKVNKLWEDLNSGKPRYVVDHTWEPFGRHREMRRLLKLKPIDVKNVDPHPLFKDKTKKIVLLSATLSPKDVEQLGLAHKRVAYIDAPSPIVAERRPVKLDYVGAMSYANRGQMAPRMAEKLVRLLSDNPGRGLVHITYSLRGLLLAALDGKPGSERLIWHEAEDKMEQFETFKESSNGVLMACGLQEGIDLPYDEARWQALLKVPWPSMAEPAVAHMLETDPDWYAWETARQVLQASGRVCRKLDDFGITYILDSSFQKLYTKNSRLFPQWWKEAVS